MVPGVGEQLGHLAIINLFPVDRHDGVAHLELRERRGRGGMSRTKAGIQICMHAGWSTLAGASGGLRRRGWGAGWPLYLALRAQGEPDSTRTTSLSSLTLRPSTASSPILNPSVTMKSASIAETDVSSLARSRLSCEKTRLCFPPKMLSRTPMA